MGKMQGDDLVLSVFLGRQRNFVWGSDGHSACYLLRDVETCILSVQKCSWRRWQRPIAKLVATNVVSLSLFLSFV